MGFGDVLCQKAVEKKNQMDWSRVGRMGFLGAFLVAPALHVWYGYLHRLIPATTTVAAVQRLALDQTIFGPLFIPVFFSSMSYIPPYTHTSQPIHTYIPPYIHIYIHI
ncbi:hypothetical protein OAV88_02670 [bacterium]|nr:hypothetical protein [bacterium]